MGKLMGYHEKLRRDEILDALQDSGEDFSLRQLEKDDLDPETRKLFADSQREWLKVRRNKVKTDRDFYYLRGNINGMFQGAAALLTGMALGEIVTRLVKYYKK